MEFAVFDSVKHTSVPSVLVFVICARSPASELRSESTVGWREAEGFLVEIVEHGNQEF